MCSAFAVLSWKGLGTGVKSIEQIRRILEDLREEIRYLQAEQSKGAVGVSILSKHWILGSCFYMLR